MVPLDDKDIHVAKIESGVAVLVPPNMWHGTVCSPHPYLIGEGRARDVLLGGPAFGRVAIVVFCKLRAEKAFCVNPLTSNPDKTRPPKKQPR